MIHRKHSTGIWVEDTNPDFNEDSEYLIKPEPREWWEVRYGKHANIASFIPLSSREDAVDFAKQYFNLDEWESRAWIVKVREVIE